MQQAVFSVLMNQICNIFLDLILGHEEGGILEQAAGIILEVQIEAWLVYGKTKGLTRGINNLQGYGVPDKRQAD